jgi:hypothetical protein
MRFFGVRVIFRTVLDCSVSGRPIGRPFLDWRLLDSRMFGFRTLSLVLRLLLLRVWGLSATREGGPWEGADGEQDGLVVV